MRPATLLAAIVLGLISVGHLVRLVFRLEVTAGSVRVPMWMSAVAFVFLGALAIALWRENRRQQ